MEPYLDETAYYDTPNCTWPFGTHIAVVEIDEETGVVDLVRYVAVDDVGNKINPMIVDGQLHGGIAQGVGQALWERRVYSDEGQLLSGSMLDYALPRASWLPTFELDETVTPSPVNPLGVKGVGEAGAIASTAAVANAVIDALERLGIRHLDMPYTAQKVWARDPVGEGRPGMIPAAFDYQRATSLDDALAAIAGGDAKVLAGGQSLLPLMKLRLAAPGTLVDIGAARASSRASGQHGRRRLEIGALTTYAELLDSPGPPLRAARATRIRDIGDVQVRNRGTVGGAHRPRRSGLGPAGPACWRSTPRSSLRSARGERTMPVDGFFRARSRPAMQPDEILTEIRLPGRCRRRRVGATRSWSTRRPATRSSAWPPSCSRPAAASSPRPASP